MSTSTCTMSELEKAVYDSWRALEAVSYGMSGAVTSVERISGDGKEADAKWAIGGRDLQILDGCESIVTHVAELLREAHDASF